MRGIFLIFLISLIAACAQQSTTTSNHPMENYKKLAYESLEVEPVEFYKNSKSDFVLATFYKNESKLTDTGTLNYVIINIGEEKVVKNGVLPQGRINWVSDYEVEIYSPPGIPKDQTETADDYKIIFNVKTGKTSNKEGANY
jgi:hypothetical protein